MLHDHTREKLLNAVIFFVSNTKSCGKTKLYKLLYFLDFAHYMEVGRSVTGLHYYAWPKGPVPVELHEQFDQPPEDMVRSMKISTRKLWNSHDMLDIEPFRPFDPTHFSKRELQLLETLADEFRDSDAQDMVEATHLENLPWHKVYEIDGKKQQLIPYELAFRAQERELTELVAAEHQDFVRNYDQ